MDKEKMKKIAYYSACGILIVIMLWAVISTALGSDKKSEAFVDNSLPSVTPVVTRVVVEKEVEKLVEVEKKITGKIIQEGLKEMGFLVTQEYSFTEVENYTSSTTYLKFFTSESNFVFSYEGEISAGVDCSQITVNKEDAESVKKITIILPKAMLYQTSIDNDSFKMYVEEQGLWDKVGLEDFNKAQAELKKTAEERALERGILEKADKTAEVMISNFVKSLVGDDYIVDFVRR